MGNKAPGGSGVGSTHRRSVDLRDFFRRPKRPTHPPSSSSSSAYNYNRDKMNSCPDLVRAEAAAHHPSSSASNHRGEEADDEKPIGIKVYRSYSDIAAADSKLSSCSEIPTLEIRVYRRSTEGLARAGKAISLPRGMERSLGVGSDMSNGSDYRPTSRQCTSAIDARSSRRGSSRCSMSSIGYRVSADEFPDTETIKRKLKDFEVNFTSGLVESFRCLPPLNQLASLSVATRPDRVNQSVSLLQYLESDSIPADLLSVTGPGSNREYILTIPERSFEVIRRVKVERLVDQRLAAAVMILEDLAREAAKELGRIFEYQLSLVIEPVSMRLLARHAVDCIIHVLKRRNRILDRNTVVQGVLRGRPRIPEHLPRLISIIIGSKELKWNIYEVFKRPALRKELFPPRSLSGSSPSWLSDDLDFVVPGLPWKFYASPQCEPMTYGYRGQLVEWDFVNCHFRLNSEEETGMCEEVSWRYDDFHRVYCPYHRLIGVDMVDSYLKTRPTSSTESRFPSLADYVRQTRSGGYTRDEVRLVFRPLGPVTRGIDFAQLGLDDFDVARVKTAESAQERTSLADTAIEVAKRCQEMRCRLEEIESLTSPTFSIGDGQDQPPGAASTLASIHSYLSEDVELCVREGGPVWPVTDGRQKTTSGIGDLTLVEHNKETITDV